MKYIRNDNGWTPVARKVYIQVMNEDRPVPAFVSIPGELNQECPNVLIPLGVTRVEVWHSDMSLRTGLTIQDDFDHYLLHSSWS
jgi:hypothetical protein